MTVLCSKYSPKHLDPCDRASFFSDEEEGDLKRLEKRESPPIGNPAASCNTNLFFGFFFDGTRNNYDQCKQNEGYSNVARLYTAYPGLGVPGVPAQADEAEWPDKDQYPHFFRVYLPGVGTPFDKVGDDGGSMWGPAAALYGHERIVWALAQAVNCVHRFFLHKLLLSDGDIRDASRKLRVTGWNLRNGDWLKRGELEAGKESNDNIFRGWLQRLHAAIAPHLHEPGAKPAKVDPGIVGNIHLSAFGFSRGATKARAFCNWLQHLCRLDAQLLGRSDDMTLGGFPVKFDFLGVFDTVASVGLASSTLLWDGHAEWADAEVSLRVPPGMPCVHLVAGHEIRRSFPLDSIQVGGSMPANSEEIMFPGVHSDVGGGYLPKEQGRGTSNTGYEMMSRIPLAVMYRKARLAGVPLKAEKANEAVKYRFKVDAKLIDDFNAYLDTLPRRQGEYKTLLKDMYLPYLSWRLGWADCDTEQKLTERFDNLGGIKDADMNDLLGGNLKLIAHLDHFRRWKNEEVVTRGRNDQLKTKYFPPTWDGRMVENWKELKPIWEQLEQGEAGPYLTPAASRLFQYYVHDSFAWFRIFGKEEHEMLAYLEKLSLRPESQLTKTQKEWVQRYRESKEAGQAQVPKIVTDGQEPFLFGGGYLHFRKVYAGDDKTLLARRQPAPDEGVTV